MNDTEKELFAGESEEVKFIINKLMDWQSTSSEMFTKMIARIIELEEKVAKISH